LMTKSTKKLLIMKLTARVWPLSSDALLAYLILKRRGCSDFEIKRAKRRS
jgi:hypothetical protein